MPAQTRSSRHPLARRRLLQGTAATLTAAASSRQQPSPAQRRPHPTPRPSAASTRCSGRPRALGARRLEVLAAELPAARLAWFELHARGAPVLFGAHDDDEGTLSGPWDLEVDGVRHPVWTARRDGSWRAWLRELVLNPPLDAALFERPASSG